MSIKTPSLAALVSILFFTACEQKTKETQSKGSSLEIELPDTNGNIQPAEVRIISLDGTEKNLCAIMRDSAAGPDAEWKVLTETAFSDKTFLSRVRLHYPENPFDVGEMGDKGGGIDGIMNDLGHAFRVLTILSASIASPVSGGAAALAFAIEGASIASVGLSGFSIMLAAIPALEGGRILARMAVDANNNTKAKNSLAELQSEEFLEKRRDPAALMAVQKALLSLQRHPLPIPGSQSCTDEGAKSPK